MKFGFFDDPNKEYVITTPKTPLPWINYLGSNNFFSLMQQVHTKAKAVLRMFTQIRIGKHSEYRRY